MLSFTHNPVQKYECMVLLPDQVEAAWPAIRELLAKAVAHGRGEVEVDDILSLVKSGKMFVGVLLEDDHIVLALAAEILTFPRKTVLNIAFMGGRGAVASFPSSYPYFNQMARLLGADAVQCMCRESMARYLERHTDFRPAYVVMERKVTR